MAIAIIVGESVFFDVHEIEPPRFLDVPTVLMRLMAELPTVDGAVRVALARAKAVWEQWDAEAAYMYTKVPDAIVRHTEAHPNSPTKALMPQNIGAHK